VSAVSSTPHKHPRPHCTTGHVRTHSIHCPFASQARMGSWEGGRVPPRTTHRVPLPPTLPLSSAPDPLPAALVADGSRPVRAAAIAATFDEQRERIEGQLARFESDARAHVARAVHGREREKERGGVRRGGLLLSLRPFF